jgi:hypothetical protein
MNIINLKLNSAGILAFKTDKKVLYTEVEECCINEVLINTLFPLCLVESWTVEKSWLDRAGEKVAVVTGTGERYLGEIVRNDYGNTVFVKYNTFEDAYNRFVTVHANGVEVTHCKKKIHIEEISTEEAERLEKILKNMPFIKILEMLCEKSDLKIEPDKVEIPDWLNSVEKIKDLNIFIENLKAGRDICDEDNF